MFQVICFKRIINIYEKTETPVIVDNVHYVLLKSG